MKKLPRKKGKEALWKKLFLPWFKFFTILPILLIAFEIIFNNSSVKVEKVNAATGINKQINFQGKLTNSDGTNVTDGTYSLIFSIYNVSSGGSNTWTETDSVTTTNGIFQVALGAVTSLPGSLDFNQDTWYLGIKVSTETSEMTPRIRLAAVPYAFNSNQVNGVSFTGANGSTYTLPASADTLAGLGTSQTFTKTNTFSPGSNAGVALTVMSTTNATPSNAVNITQSQGGADGVDLNITNTSGTNINGLLVNENGSGGTTTNGIQIQQSAGTLSNGLTFSGTIGTEVNLGTIASGSTGISGTLANTTSANVTGLSLTTGTITTSGTQNAESLTLTAIGAGTTNGISLTPPAITTSGGTINGINIGTITTSNGTDTALTVGSGWDNVLSVNSTPIVNGSGVLQSAGLSGTYSNNLTFNGTTLALGNAAGTVALTLGSDATGDIFYRNSSGNLARLAIGTDSQCLIGGTTPSWGSCGAGGSTTLQQAYNLGQSIDFTGVSATAGLTLGTNAGSGNVVIQPNAGGQAALIINKQGLNDVFTASASGTTLFRITNTGGIVMQGDIITSIGSGSSGTGSNAVTNATGDQGSLIPNSGFESAVTGGLADGWTVAATSSATVTRDTANFAKGAASLKITSTSTNQNAAFYSDCVPLAGAGNYNLFFYEKGSSTTLSVMYYIDQYTTKANCQSNTSAKSTTPIPAATTVAFASKGTSGYTGSTNGWSTTTTWGRVHFFVVLAPNASTVNIDGVRLIQNSTSTGVDYAENYEANPSNLPLAGDVAELEDLNGQAVVNKANILDNNSIVGIVSTNPGEVLDDGTLKNPVTIALAGRVPVKVSTKNGSIHIGDYLTASDIPGVAVKATSAGQVIGIAMADYTNPDPEEIGNIVTFIKNTYYDAGTSGLSGVNNQLTQLIGQNQSLNNLSLTTDGKILINSDNSNNAIRIDSKGNATFAGVVSASEIKADKIDGLDEKLASLSAEILESTSSGVLGISEIATSSSTPHNDNLINLSVDGLATVSGDLRTQGNGLVEGMFNVIKTLTTNNFIATGLSNFFGDVIFNGAVTFTHHPVFNTDSAGYAVVKQGSDQVNVKFDQSYINTPIINASIVVINNSNQSAIFSNNYLFVITNISNTGFTIQLNKNAQSDLEFSWSAIDVNTNNQAPSLDSPSLNASPSGLMDFNSSSSSSLSSK